MGIKQADNRRDGKFAGYSRAVRGQFVSAWHTYMRYPRKEVKRMESSRLSARLAAYLDAIQSARKAGVTWTQLGAVFGTSGKYMSEAAKVAASGKYLAHEQLPLPSSIQEATKAEPRRATGTVKNVGQDNPQSPARTEIVKTASGTGAVDWEALARKNKTEVDNIQWKG